MNQKDCKTLEDLERLTMAEIIQSTHIIVGDKGMCMCGVYNEKALSCFDIMDAASAKYLMLNKL